MAETNSKKLSRRASGGDTGAAPQSGGSVEAAPSLYPLQEWHAFTPAAVLAEIGAGTVFTARLPGGSEVPAIANSHGQILDPKNLHLLRHLPTHFSKTVA
jgi:hypothetical protein